MKDIVAGEVVERKIFLIRGQRVILSIHLAKLYGVQVKVLVQAVKRNIDRFPEDFMFQLSADEYQNLKSQIVTSSWGGLRRAYPYAFTEQGVAMLSSVLHSKRAIQVNIAIMRAFVKLRKILSTHKEFVDALKELERKVENHSLAIKDIFGAIRRLMVEPKPKKIIKGFAQK